MEQIFFNLNPEYQKIFSRKVYQRGDVIFYEDTPSFGLFYLAGGTIKIYTQDSNGKEVILRLASRGDLLGHCFLMGKQNHTNSAKVLKESDCYFIENKRLNEVMLKNPDFSNLIMEKMGQELSLFQKRCVDLMKKNVRERLASYFCFMADHFGDQGKEDIKINLQLSREEIASMIGTANETAIRFISEFKQLGLVREENRYFHIPDIKKLKQFEETL